MSLVSRINDLTIAVREKFNTLMPRLLPSGGTVGQVITKTGVADLVFAWQDPASGGGGGGTVFAVEVNFGVASRRQLIVDIAAPGVTSADKILAWQAGVGATGRDADENEMDQFHIVAFASIDTIRFAMTCLSGTALGAYVIHYQIS